MEKTCDWLKWCVCLIVRGGIGYECTANNVRYGWCSVLAVGEMVL